MLNLTIGELLYWTTTHMTDYKSLDKDTVLQHVRKALQCEADAIAAAANRVDASIAAAIQLLSECQGRLIITGMGKMGLIGRKAAATFSSTGAPAIFLHPVDALHGDLGIVASEDVVLALSNSGSTEEIITLLPFMQRRGVPVIALTGRLDSPLAKSSSVVIDTSVEKEADPISAAPTASSTVALAMCDALAVALMHVKGFTSEQFAEFHPGGNLGKKLLTTVEDLMRVGEQLPIVSEETLIRDAIVVMSKMALGCAFVLNSNRSLLGILTDGDLRRLLSKRENPLGDCASEHMSQNPTTIQPGALAAEALRLMEEKSITVLPVVDAHGQTVGAIHLHHLLAAGLA